jgi:hypothetical protein
VRACWGVSPEEASEAVSRIPLLHVHGDLGRPNWSPAAEYRRAYWTERPSLKELRDCAQRIRIVHEDIGQETADPIADYFDRAETVCFLGFGTTR